MGAAAICFLVGCWTSQVYATRTGRSDPSEVVIDEVAGQWLVLSVVPNDLMLYVAGFLLFRLFDIWKPWPVRWADQTLPGGFGIMVDDILAALYAAALLWLLKEAI